MVATRSRVGTPQAFISLPYLCLDYLLYSHPGKPVADKQLCALDVGELIPKPFGFRECDPLPTVRPCPHTPVTLPNENPTAIAGSSLAFGE
jgi:hypothetical protein